MRERHAISRLLQSLKKQRAFSFPARRQQFSVPEKHGVYVVSDSKERAVHVGRTVSGKAGLRQRLTNHLRGKSSFARKYLRGRGDKLRSGYAYRYIEVPDSRKRVLLEYAATVWYCPKHLGVGIKNKSK
jgi:hypothetical protein